MKYSQCNYCMLYNYVVNGMAQDAFYTMTTWRMETSNYV